jgi:hypothetical protein
VDFGFAHDFGPTRIGDDEARFEGHQAGPRGLICAARMS